MNWRTGFMAFRSRIAVIAPAMVGPLLISISLAACTAKPSAPAPANIPPDEAWLTSAQVTEGRLETKPVQEESVDDQIVTSGKVTFDDSRVSHMFSPVSGRVTRIEGLLGQRVKKGEPLAVIESPDIGLASSDVHKADADRIAAEHDLDRQRELLAAKATSQRDYEQAEDAYRKARAELERAQQKARLFRAGSVDVVTQSFTMRAEIDGEVIARNVTPGMEVQGQYSGGTAVELFTIGELDRVWIIADVYEMDVGRVAVGSKVNVRLVAFPGQTFKTTVDWVSGVLDPLTRTGKIRCVLENPDKKIKPEMYATLFVSVDERKALSVPRSALLRVGDKLAVFVERGAAPDGRRVFARQFVTADESEGGPWVPVTQGLEKGANVVVSGSVLLTGMVSGVASK